jgi:TonB family protein
MTREPLETSETARTRARGTRARQELELAESWMRTNPAERRRVAIAVAVAVVVHAVVLVAHMPGLGPRPVRLDAPAQQPMQVKFLKPPAPPKAERKPEPPKPKRVPRPDTTPDEPEPEVAPEPPAEEPTPQSPPEPAGPVRVAPGQGPGLIKRVEPEYPPMARTARITGTVVLDAIIRKDGTVSDVKVVRSSHKLFEQPSIDAVRQWQFTPFQYNVVLTVTVTFVLR